MSRLFGFTIKTDENEGITVESLSESKNLKITIKDANKQASTIFTQDELDLFMMNMTRFYDFRKLKKDE